MGLLGVDLEASNERGKIVFKNVAPEIDAAVAPKIDRTEALTKISDAALPKLDKTEAASTYVARAEFDPSSRIKLRKWYAKLAARNAAPAQILVEADSIGEGTGSTLAMSRWIARLQTRLRATLGVAGGAATPYISAAPAYTPLPADYPSATVTGGSLADGLSGLGARCRYSQVTGYIRSFTFYGTSAQVLYTTDVDGGNLQIAIDGGAYTTLSGLSAQRVPSVVYQISGLTPGVEHVITVRRSTGFLRIEGVIVYNGDETSGIRIYDGSHHGTQSNRIVGTQGAAEIVAQGKLGTLGLIMLGFGTNDYGNISAPDLKTNYLAYMAASRAAGFDGSFLLYLPYTHTFPAYQPYVDALREIAAGDADTYFVNWADRMPQGTSGATGLGLYTDTYHNTDTGHIFISDFFATILLP